MFIFMVAFFIFGLGAFLAIADWCYGSRDRSRDRQRLQSQRREFKKTKICPVCLWELATKDEMGEIYIFLDSRNDAEDCGRLDFVDECPCCGNMAKWEVDGPN